MGPELKKWQDKFPDKKSKGKFDYSATIQQVNLTANLIRESKIQEALDEISTSHAIAPMLNPTAYMAALDPLRHQTRILEAALEFQKIAKEEIPKLAEASEKGRAQIKRSMTGLKGILE